MTDLSRFSISIEKGLLERLERLVKKSRYANRSEFVRDLVLASTHVHLDEHMCAEMVLTKGPASEIEEMASLLRQQKGVLHASLSLSSTGRELG